MLYRAVLNLDLGKQDNNEYQKLIAALVESGWKYVETSALWIETDRLPVVWRGIELAARQSSYIGEISALTFHFQGTDFPDGKDYPAVDNHPYAVSDIQSRPLPAP